MPIEASGVKIYYSIVTPSEKLKMQKGQFIHQLKMKSRSFFFLILFFALNFSFATNSFATNSLSYSGRLVQTNGAPVAGPVDLLVELAYTNAPSTILCSQSFTGVALTNGVFHLKLDFTCGGNGALADVLSAVPTAESAAIRVTDVTHSKVYSFQAVHSMPFANIAATSKQLVQMGATTGQVLQWNGTSWAPSSVGGGGVSSVSGTLPITVTTGTTAPVISMPQANSTTNGYLSSADWNAFNSKQGTIAAGTATQYYRGDKSWQTLDTSAVPENVANLYFTNVRVLGVPLAGFAAGAGPIVATDSTLQAFGKAQGQINALNAAGANYLIKNSTDSITGVVNVGTTGLLQLGYAPVGLTDATNKSYVDAGDALKVNKAGDTMSGALALDGDLKIKGGVNYVTLKGHAASSSYNLILPSSAGTSGNVLQTDGAGNLSWVAPATSTAPTGAAGGDLAGAYPNPTIGAGKIVDANVSVAAAIAQSKVANLTSDLAAKELAANVPADVRSTTLTGYSVGTNTAITATDTVLSAFKNIQAQLNAKISSETDPSVSAFAKTALPTCSAGEVLKSNGTSLSCVTDNAGAGSFAGTMNRVVLTDGATGALTTSSVTNTELGYVGGVTSAIQTQINAKQATITSSTALTTGSVQTNLQNAIAVNPFNTAAGNTGEFRFYELAANGANYTGFKSPDSLTANLIYVLPSVGPTAGQVLSSDASGTMSWITPPSAPVTSVNGSTGVVTLTTTNVAEGTNLYYTDARTLAAPLTGYAAGANAALAATDTVLGAFQKVQGQLNAKANSASIVDWSVAGVQTLEPTRLNLTTANRAVVTNASGVPTPSAVTSTELGFSSGVTSNIQTQLNAKQATITSSTALATGSVQTNLQNAVAVNPFNTAAGNTGEFRFYELAANGANYTGFKSPDSLTANFIYVLPSVAPTAGQVLSSDASGNMSWLSIPSAPVSSVFGRTGAVVSASGDYTATQITNTPAGNIAATTVQAALNELDTKKQEADATLSALAAYNTNGLLVQTGADTFVGRSIAGAANRVSVTNGDGVSGNPTINLDTTLFPSPIAGDAGKFLKATGANASAWNALASSDVTTALGFAPVNKAGDSLTTGTIALSGTAALTVQNPVNVLDAANKQYVDSFGQWTKGSGANAADIYRASGNVGIGTATPAVGLDMSAMTDAMALPVGTTAQRPSTAVNGLTRYNSTLAAPEMRVRGQWQKVATRTSDVLTLYVRTDGSDTSCNGSVNAASASAPNCAFATPWGAIDSLPDIIRHSVTIRIVAGTYYFSTAGLAAMNIINHQQGYGVNLTLQSDSGLQDVVISGATSAAPTTAVAAVGLYGNGSNIILDGLKFQYFTGTGIYCTDCNSLILNNVRSDYVPIGVRGDGSGLSLTNTTLTSTTSWGLYLERASSATIVPPFTATSPGNGIGATSGSTVGCSAAGTISVTNATASGLVVAGQSSLTISGSCNASVSGTAGATGHGLYSYNGSTVSIYSSLTISGGFFYGITSLNQTTMTLAPASGKTISLSTTDAGAGRTAIYASNGSYVGIGGAGNFTSGSSWDGNFYVIYHSTVSAGNAGTVTVDAANTTSIYYNSVYVRSVGTYPVAGTCTASYCP